MAKDTFRIRIRPDGTIHFLSRDLGVERMRLLREMLEDSLGPVHEIRPLSDSDGDAPGVAIVDHNKIEELKRHE